MTGMSKCHLGVVQKEKVAATCKVGFPKKWKVIREIKRPDLLVQAVQPLCPLPASIKSYLSACILPQTMEETISNTPCLYSDSNIAWLLYHLSRASLIGRSALKHRPSMVSYANRLIACLPERSTSQGSAPYSYTHHIPTKKPMGALEDASW